MSDLDTQMGGEAARFPSTSLAMIVGAAGDRKTIYREHIERLFSTYWKPVYLYIRTVWSKSDADSKDLAQGFFMSMLEYDTVSRFDPQKGNFRAYLKQCLKNFLKTDKRDAERLKRGGGQQFVSFDDARGIAPDSIMDPTSSPDDAFDGNWTAEVLNAAISELEVHFQRQSKKAYFEVFRLSALDADSPLTYREIAQRLDLSESDVRNYLHAARRELRAAVMRHISEYVADEDEMLRELERILGDRA